MKTITKKKLLSVVVPCLNEAEVLPLFFSETAKALKAIGDIESELVFVDDGSTDGTLGIIKSFVADSDVKVKYVSLSRNFGKEAAIFAGLRYAKGDYVILMDADLQHPPKYIAQMLNALVSEGYDSCAMYRVGRKGERKGRSLSSKLFFRIMKRLSNTEIVEGATDYRIMTRQMTDAVLSMQEYNRFSKGIFGFVGFNTKWLPYESTDRAAGKTKWSFGSLLRYSVDGIVSFSSAPLILSSVLGIIFCLIAFIMALIVVIKTLIWGDPVAGFPTLFCIIMMVGGVLLLFLGIIGQYISRMYLETKHRPIYIVKDESPEQCCDEQPSIQQESPKAP